MTHECVPDVLKLSSNVNECKPLEPGSPLSAVARGADGEEAPRRRPPGHGRGIGGGDNANGNNRGWERRGSGSLSFSPSPMSAARSHHRAGYADDVYPVTPPGKNLSFGESPNKSLSFDSVKNGRGLQSFPFQLNLSSSVHRTTHINS